MSKNKSDSKRSKWNSFDWDSLDYEPPVVNATFNAQTNDFEVSQPIKQRDWSFDDSYSVQQQRNEPSSKGNYSDEALTVTFRLNLEEPENPVFTKVVDYDSFRDQDIIPDYDDLMTPTNNNQVEEDYSTPIPDVPVNKLRSPYESVKEYLYTHFELMRHDFLLPLREAINGYRQEYASLKGAETMGESMEKLLTQKPFRLYEHVQLNAIVFGSRQPLHRISFRLPYSVRVQWAQSKRLMPGSLVLLSKDHFKSDLKIATVVDRGEEEPMKGPDRFEYLIDIYLERDNEDQPLGFGDPTLSDKDVYVMIEATNGYFEAYRHVLKVLQKVEPDQFPFSSYLVNLSKDILIPHYAARKRVYDINVFKRHVRDERWPVDIMGSWPEYRTGMDKTQLDALKTILTRNLSIIQGPPGTGKTFVGTYAMRVLLNNFNESLGPIVCICQTNHALDQFLEHILAYNDKIVRVGGRSKSELLKEHTMYELKKALKGPRGIGRLYRSRDDIMTQIEQTIIELYEQPCVTLEFLESIKALRPRQLECLKRAINREKKYDSGSDQDLVSDSDDEWEITSVVPTKKPPQNQKRRGKNGRRGNHSKNNDNDSWNNINSFWDEGNPNRIHKAKEKTTNPIEIWLKEAIEFVTDSDKTTFDELAEDLLEQTKGVVYEDMIDENEIIEEDQFEEMQRNFQGDDFDNKAKYRFISLGKAYQRLTEVNPGERQGRRIVNYNKTGKPAAMSKPNFDFFDDIDDVDDIWGNDAKEKSQSWENEPSENQSLERWMKEDDVFMWPLSVRLKAHKEWIDLRNQSLEATLRRLMSKYTSISAEIRSVMVKYEAKICRENRVVGMTSTAAAKYHDLLEEMRPRIMVVEEAAEMVESHIVSALTSSLEHLILIGDHQQLRPSTSVHKLSEVHGLSVSLFERLIINQFPFTRLSHQRRMLPAIRQLINPIYRNPPLQDHPDVSKYPPVRGMAQPLFFLSHQEEETSLSDSASKVNEHEAKIAARLTLYLLQQGYKAEEITIITMYSGQKMMLRKMLREERTPMYDLNQVKVSSVDGYQGEENKIIILSLVRSSSNGQIGFLKTANRVCVALSRAKHGLYILGNASLLCDKSELWNEIIANLEEREERMIDTKLPLQCVKHNVITEIQYAVDFTDVSEGGCNKPCGEKLRCGHECLLKCHPYDHDDVLCRHPCGKMLKCRHPCPNYCFQHCGPCTQVISVRLPCGDTIEESCSKIRTMAKNPERHRCPTCNSPLSVK